MGLMDKVKGLVGGHKDQAKEGVDKATGVAEEKVGDSHSDQITSAGDKTKEGIDKLDDGVQ